MARTLRPLGGPLRSWEGVRSDPHAPRNLVSERALIRRRWESPAIRRLRTALDAVEHTTKPYRYPRSTLFGICLVALLLRCHVRDAHRRVQSDPELRVLFGLPDLTPETERRLASARRREDISEDGFPSRTLVETFIHEWLPDHPELVRLLDREAYETTPGDALLRHDISSSRFVVDGSQLISIRRGRRGEQTDPGARLMGREGEAAELQRWKMTALLTDVPLVIDGEAITPYSETVYVREEMVPRLHERSERLRERARREGRTDIKGLHRAAALGDNAFANTPPWEALYDHGMYGAFEPPDFPARRVEGKRLVSYEVRGEATRRSVDLSVCNDGVHFCECEDDLPEGERTPMRQHAGSFGKTGEVYVVCERLGCPHRGRRLYIPFRQPDRILARGRREAGEVDYTRVNPLWRGDKKVAALNWLGPPGHRAVPPAALRAVLARHQGAPLGPPLRRRRRLPLLAHPR